MEIISLELSGFINYESKTNFNYKDKHNNLIFDMNGQSNSFFFEAILGTIFGFSSEEKVKFRGDPELNKTFTAMITLSLDQRTMIIERDFETDFVACLLSDTKTTRSIFQGKDFAENDFSRPYLQMLRSIFPIIDKELFVEICYDLATNDKRNFSDLLDILYSLLTPQFKFSNVKYLISEGNLQEQECLRALTGTDPLNKFQCSHKALQHIIKIKKNEDDLQSDIHKLEVLIEGLKSRYNLSQRSENLIAQDFPTLVPFNPLQLRADVLIWKSLLDVKEKNEEKLRSYALRTEHLENILKHDLYEYTKLPDTFNKDAQRFKERSLQLSYSKKAYKDYETQIEEMKETMNKGKVFRLGALLIVPLVLFALSYLVLGPLWIFIVPETIITFFILLVFSGHATHKKRNRIYHYTEETHILEKRIRDAQEEKNQLLKKSHLFKEPQYIDSHLQRFKKCRQYQRELRVINRDEMKLNELMVSDTYQGQINRYEDKYGSAIDINRRDLEEYLDRYISVKQELDKRKQNMEFYPAISELQKLCDAHRQGIKELKDARQHMTKALKIENETTDLTKILDKLDRKIKNYKLQQNINTITSLH